MAGNGFIGKLWHWFDEYFLLWATGLLLVFIPLYPKIPLSEIIPGYIVRLRLEDILILAVFFWWLIQLVRRKVEWRTPLSLSILAYLLVGLLSNVLGVVLTKTIPAEPLHVAKSMLHWLRHIEYFSLFFVAYNAVRSKRQGFSLTMVAVATLIGVAVYGYGQKYLFWPVYSTMNREFSKGIRLYLSEFARVQSTFAGHYDLGAYLVILLPLTLAVYFGLDRGEWKDILADRWRKAARWFLLAGWLSGLWLLAVSASRASFVAYMVSAGLVVGLFFFRRGWRWALTRGMATLIASLMIVLVVGELPSRFAQLIDQNKYPQVWSAYNTVNDYFKNPAKILGIASLVDKPEGGLSVEEYEQKLSDQGMTRSDEQPTSQRPQDVFVDVPEKTFDLDDPAATLAGGLVQYGDKLVQQRTYSACALERSLSLCIRFETLWPRAIQGFISNPLFGSGYATLTKENVGQFTEAESTDNNFLRTLGENGALGFFFYYGAVGLSLWYAIQAFRNTRDPWLTALAVGVIAGGTGLLLNATYLDVFVASKVAYIFWLVQGVALAVFVREGVAAQQFAFYRHKVQAATSELSRLLAAVDQKQADKSQVKQAYLSSKKRRARSARTKRSVRRG